MGRIKVLVVSEQWWPEGSGGILSTYLKTEMLRELGFGVTVLHGTRSPRAIDGAEFIYSGLLSVRNKHRLWANCLLLSRERWFRNLLEKHDIIYIPRLCYPLIGIAKDMGKKVIVNMHDYQPVSHTSVIFHESYAKKGFMKSFREVFDFEIRENRSLARALLSSLASPLNRLGRTWLSRADRILCVSKRQCEIVSRMAPELSEKLYVVYNPPPRIGSVGKELGEKILLYLGGDSYIKGFYILLEALRKLSKREKSPKILLAGKYRGDSIGVLKSLNNTEILGYVRHEELLNLHRKAYAVVFPSITEEPLPRAVMEAMVTATIPIASRVGGVPEMVEGTWAEKMLFEPHDIEGLIDRIELLSAMPREQIIDIGLSLREAALRKFNPDSIKEKLGEVFSP